ncbi:MAG: alpha/beta hydrolase [Alphaproteobacteria bacterium]|jgi:haloacetate dehalogenase|nr:alpha/beta hydrolase [Alphaproteobacteria bacterium]
MFEGFERSRVDIDGCGIHVVYGGAGPPLLMLHGYPQSHVEWHKVAPRLAERFTVVCPDLRGYGDSDKPASSDADLSTYCKRRTAADQVAVVQALGFESFHLVGHDRGVRVGLRLALDHPDKVLSLTNLDVVPSLEAFENMDASLAFSWFHWNLMRQPSPLPETVFSNNAQLFLDFFLDAWSADRSAFTDEAYQEYLRCFSDPETVRACCADYRGVALDLEHDAADRGTKLACPVLVLWAGNMPRRPGWQTGQALDMLSVWRARADDVRGRALDCGHFIPEERPDELVAELLDFLPAP